MLKSPQKEAFKNKPTILTVQNISNFLFFSKLKAYGSHSVLFLNIKSYAGGTRPWNRKNGNQDINDGLIEVVAIDNLDLAILHAGQPFFNVGPPKESIFF